MLDEKDAASKFIRLSPHHFARKPIDGTNSTFDFTAPDGSWTTALLIEMRLASPAASAALIIRFAWCRDQSEQGSWRHPG